MAQREMDWALAGLTTEEGELGRPTDSRPWTVPADVHATDGQLLWRGTNQQGQVRDPEAPLVHPDRGLLLAFTKLADDPDVDGDGRDCDQDVAQFARRWGVLNLCADHLKPMPRSRGEHEAEFDKRCRLAGGVVGGLYREPIFRWRDYARQARAILDITASLRSNEPHPVTSESWTALAELHEPVEANILQHVLARSDGSEIPLQRRILEQSVQEWLRLGEINITIDWSSEHAGLTYVQGTLFAGLALQLALAVTSSNALAICDECGRAYAPKRQPKAGHKKYCDRDECRVLAAKRDSARRRRLRADGP